MTASAIEWTDATWNPIRGCSRVSDGCRNCYAETMAARFTGPGQAYEGLAHRVDGEARWTGQVRVIKDKIYDPIRWKRPRKIFVNSMSDLFQEGVPDYLLDEVFEVMGAAERHTFQVLTKRADRMLKFCGDRWGVFNGKEYPMPPNIWLGVTVEGPAFLGRLDALRATPAAVRFVSFEPLLKDLGAVDLRGIGWVIVGGESGHGARPFCVEWAADLVRRARAAGAAPFVKQLGRRPYTTNANLYDFPAGARFSACYPGTPGFMGAAAVALVLRSPKGGNPAEWPEDLRVREYPTAARSGA